MEAIPDEMRRQLTLLQAILAWAVLSDEESWSYLAALRMDPGSAPRLLAVTSEADMTEAWRVGGVLPHLGVRNRIRIAWHMAQ